MTKLVKILIVDDDPAQLTLLEHLLHTNPGYRILKAGGEQEAMRIAEEEVPSLIVSDYYMQDGDGFTLCTKVKNHPHLYDTMFMLLTVASDTQNKLKGYKIGADDYLTKPFGEEEFLSRTHALLRIKSLQDELKEDKSKLVKLNEELEEGFMGVIKLLTHLIGLRVPGAAARGQRAAQISEWIGERLEFNDEERKAATIAALFHEIGKITLSDDIIMKDRQQLGPAERENLSQSPMMGQLLLGDIPKLKEVGEYLRYQMENYDGSGFPDRLMKNEIPAISHLLRGINYLEELEASHKDETETILNALRVAKGNVIDPRIGQLLEEFVLIHGNAAWLEGKRQVSVYELREGMVLASDLFTGSGIKLLPKDSRIQLSSLEKILQHHHCDPIINSIFVY